MTASEHLAAIARQMVENPSLTRVETPGYYGYLEAREVKKDFNRDPQRQKDGLWAFFENRDYMNCGEEWIADHIGPVIVYRRDS